MTAYKAIACLEIVAGAALIVFSTTAVNSSWLTPYLSFSPYLLTAIGSFGGLLLLVSCAFSIVAGICRQRRLYYYLAAFQAFLFLVVRYTLWGTIFQLGLAGLTVGGSLIGLGAVAFRSDGEELS